jgi:hypothetical protein
MHRSTETGIVSLEKAAAAGVGTSATDVAISKVASLRLECHCSGFRRCDPTVADSSGNVYDAHNGVVGIVPSVGIAVDSSGNIYSSDGIHILVLKPAGAIAPPTSVSVDFVNNAACNRFLGIAPGEIVTFKGSGLGPAQLVSARAGSRWARRSAIC